MILVEEIENGINPGNIQEFISWLWQAVGPPESLPRERTTQFLLTSHSPSVLREFAEQLDHVYTVRLERRTFTSDVRNLNDAMDALVGLGTIEGQITERDDKRLVIVPRHQLTELWYSGRIG